LPVTFARGIAGYRGVPVHIKRNELVPPIGLQKQIFPFVESAYKSQSKETQERWERECEDDMNELDTDGFVSLEEEVRIFKERWLTNRTRAIETDADVVAADPDIAKRRFLKLLVRLRRVILQDAVVYFHLGLIGPVLNNELFTCEGFKSFQHNLIEVIAVSEPTIPADIPQN
ncbi:hypothetical protein BGX27_006714, partial [Mortierella sp. AM989]